MRTLAASARVLALAGVCLFSSAARTPPRLPASGAEILWDTYGVPHIFAADDAALLRAFGWAQARNHANLLLQRIGIARGRAAEYWGAAYVRSDVFVRNVRLGEAARAGLAAQPAGFRTLLQAFAGGIDAYAARHPEAIADSLKVVLPVTAEDVLANAMNLSLEFSFALGQARAFGERGSNAWAIAPARSADGHAILLANPHLPWAGALTWMEAQLESPSVRAYGATLVGVPVLEIAFNDDLGWTHTASPVLNETLFVLKLAGDGYRWEGGTRAFTVDTQHLRIKADGSFRDTLIARRQSVHGPVLALRGDRALAVRSATDSRDALLEYWEMARAHDLRAFERALTRNQIAHQSVMYADAAGNILYVYGQAIPRRPRGDYTFWLRPQPGDSAALLWQDVHPAADAPRALNPPTGWLQNANDPPWSCTYPPVMRPDDFPASFAPVGLGLNLRAQRSIRLLRDAGKLSFEDVLRLKDDAHSELADRVLPDLVAAARAASSPAARAAADVLERWDRTADPDSRGGTLFEAWVREMARRQVAGPGSNYARRWSAQDPLGTPRGLADPAAAVSALDSAATRVGARFGALDVPWGQTHRFRRDSVDLPGTGGPNELGIFRVISYATPPGGGPDSAYAGRTYVAIVEFSRPLRAQTLLVYGNASQPGSPHRTDQLRLAAAGQLRPVWRTRQEIERHLAEREALERGTVSSTR